MFLFCYIIVLFSSFECKIDEFELVDFVCEFENEDFVEGEVLWGVIFMVEECDESVCELMLEFVFLEVFEVEYERLEFFGCFILLFCEEVGDCVVVYNVVEVLCLGKLDLCENVMILGL